MLHQILLDLKKCGHEILVLTKNPSSREYDGVQIRDLNSKKYEKLIGWCDVVITHLWLAKKAAALAKLYNKKIVSLLHSHYNYDPAVAHSPDADLLIANSVWVKKTNNQNIPIVVVNPPTSLDTYTVETTREYVTLINMADHKGGGLFWELAESMPDVNFLGVVGAHGNQVMHDRWLPNLQILPTTMDIQSVYSKTKILLIPSEYESWGRVGVEALCSGIPVIATPTPGLKESLGDAGIFVGETNGYSAHRGELSSWVEAIRSLSDKDTYLEYSKLGKKRAEKLVEVFKHQISLLENKLLEIINNK